MADTNLPVRPLPAGWSDAFAAMPLEHAPADAWTRLSTGLASEPARPAGSGRTSRSNPRRRPAMRLAIAAAASIAIALPAAWWLGFSPQAPHGSADGARAVATTAQTQASGSRGDARRHVAGVARRDVATATATATARTITAATAAATATATAPASTPATAVDASRHRAVSSMSRPPSLPIVAATAILAPPATTVDPADGAIATAAIAPPDPLGDVIADAPSTATVDPGSRLDALRQASARLETLVAYARDDRMSSAPAAVVSASLDDRIRLIDAALMQPGLDDMLRSSLWSERVGALQELASLEGAQRWMAAHGASMDAVARVD